MATILLVEDNELNRDMLSRRLERMDYDVILAVDGQDGIDKAKAERPDLILMDINLPVVDGWEATRILKADPDTAAIPIIALTAHAMSSDRDHATEVGCVDFESKPVDFHRLIEKIMLHLYNAQNGINAT